MDYFLLAIGCSICIGMFIWRYRAEPRSLFLGLTFLAALGSTAFAAAYIILRTNNPIMCLIVMICFLIAMLLLLCSPLFLTIAFLSSGIRLIKKEGRRLTNLLSLAFGLALLILPFATSFCLKMCQSSSLAMTIYNLFALLMNYLIVIMSLYTVSSMLNLIHFRKPKFDYVVVLGSGIFGTEVPPLLASRIEKGMEICRKCPGCKMIVSGGQGPGEDIPEAHAMAQYALDHGFGPEDLLMEDQSRNTWENLLFSKELMTEGSRFALATNDYHVFRALLIARQLKLKCKGYGSKTKFYFMLNAYLRELVGYLYLKRKLYTAICIGVGILFTVFSFF